jgi:hypothetical protein
MTRVPVISRRDGVLMGVLYALLVAGLIVIPRLIPSDPAVMSAAAVDGYSTTAAFWTVLAWALLVTGTFAARQRRGQFNDAGARYEPSAASGHDEGRPGHLDWRELLVVFAVFAAAYFPPFLARYGPYSEDLYFLAALARMDCGQLPYRDFGFLYGPTMIYAAWAWSQLFGAGLGSYFGLLALIEGLLFALLMGVLQRLVPQRRQRYLVFLLLLPFLFNNLFGLNYNGLRFLVPTLAVVLAALRPHDRAATVGCALLLGIHLTYSHEYALAALIAILGMHAVLFLRGQRRESLLAASTIGFGSAAIWLAVTLLLLRDTMASYLEFSAQVVSMMSAGHAGFRFYWTANSLALFGLLTMACLIVGRRVGSGTVATLEAGGRLMLGGVLFALVALRSGLTRADLWHLNPSFLPLLLAFLLPVSIRVIPHAGLRRLALGLVLIASLSFLVGIAPMGSLYVTSFLRGAVDVLSATPTGAQAGSRVRGIETERTHPRADLLALSSYLNGPERADQPVLFYGRTWDVPPRIGVCPAHYKLDDLMYSEFSRREAAFLEEHAATLIVIREEDYTRLFGLSDGDASHAALVLTPAKQLGRWLSTVHYDSAETEARLQDEARERLTGGYVRSRYAPAARFGDLVVLSRR